MAEHFKAATALVELLDHVQRGGALRLGDIQERVGCTAATAARYRDWIDARVTLKEGSREGRNKVWYKVVAKDYHPDDIARAAALAFALDLFVELKGTPHYRHVEHLAGQYRSSLPEAAVVELDRITQNFRVCGAGRSMVARQDTILCLLMVAIEHRHPCVITHHKETGEVRTYSVQPWGLILHRHRLLLVAGREPDQGSRIERRFFNVDGIQELKLMGDEVFQRPAPRQVDWEEIFRESFGVYANWHEEVVEAVLQVRGSHAVRLKQREVHVTQQIERADDQWLTLRLRVRPCPDFIGWVLSMIPDVRVVGPPRLQEKVGGLVNEWLALDRSFGDRSSR